MSMKTLSGALETLIGDEISGKARLSQELARQEQALVEGRSAEIEEATRAVEIELGREIELARRRDAIFARLAAHWSIAANALTLASITERLGESGERIGAMRAELRAAIADVLRRNRRIARLVGVHQGIVNETVSTLLGVGGGDQEPGSLFEARG